MSLHGDLRLSLLHEAVAWNRLYLIKFFLYNHFRQTINVDICDALGKTPLHVAALHGLRDAAMMLIEEYVDLDKGNDLNKKDDAEGKSPLHYAAENGHIEVVKLLVQFGALVDIKDKNNKTPRQLAQESGYYDVRKFLDSKVQSNNEDLDKQTIKLSQPPLIGLAGYHPTNESGTTYCFKV